MDFIITFNIIFVTLKLVEAIFCKFDIAQFFKIFVASILPALSALLSWYLANRQIKAADNREQQKTRPKLILQYGQNRDPKAIYYIIGISHLESLDREKEEILQYRNLTSLNPKSLLLASLDNRIYNVNLSLKLTPCTKGSAPLSYEANINYIDADIPLILLFPENFKNIEGKLDNENKRNNSETTLELMISCSSPLAEYFEFKNQLSQTPHNSLNGRRFLNVNKGNIKRYKKTEDSVLKIPTKNSLIELKLTFNAFATILLNYLQNTIIYAKIDKVQHSSRDLEKILIDTRFILENKSNILSGYIPKEKNKRIKEIIGAISDKIDWPTLDLFESLDKVTKND